MNLIFLSSSIFYVSSLKNLGFPSFKYKSFITVLVQMECFRFCHNQSVLFISIQILLPFFLLEQHSLIAYWKIYSKNRVAVLLTLLNASALLINFLVFNHQQHFTYLLCSRSLFLSHISFYFALWEPRNPLLR